MSLHGLGSQKAPSTDSTVISDYPSPQPPTDVSFSDFFLRFIAPYEQRIAMMDPQDGSTITYAALRQHVERVRSALYRIGVAHRDVIGTYTGNSPHFIILSLAATSIGAILAPLNPAYKTHEVEKYFRDANVKWIVTEECYLDKLSKGVILDSVQATILLDSAQSTYRSFGLQGFVVEQTRPTVETAVIGEDPVEFLSYQMHSKLWNPP